MAKDLLLTLEDTPGEAARFGEALGNAGVNIEGLSAVVRDGRGIVHILVEDVEGARAALDSAGIRVESETDVVVGSPLSDSDMDTPGRFGRLARAAADAGINITHAYMASGNRIVLATSDNARTQELLRTTM